LIHAAILAVFCISWGLSEPILVSLLHVNIGVSISQAFMNPELPILMGLLGPVFILAYWSYYKGFNRLRNIAAGKNPLASLLNHRFFIDDFYYAVVKGIQKLSAGSLSLDGLLNRLCSSATRETERLSGKLIQFDDSINQQLYAFAEFFLQRTRNVLNKVPSKTFQNYIAAVIVGVILMVVIIILTRGL